MLDQLNLEGSGTCPAAVPKSVKYAMECNLCPYVAVQDEHYHLTQDLYETYLPKISAPFWDQDHSLPCHFLGEQAIPEFRL